MNKSYYTPSIEELHVGFVCEKKPLYHEVNTYGDFQTITCDRGQMDYIFLELSKGHVRVQHLHETDFTGLGMTCEKVPVISAEGYICSAKINYPRNKDIPVKMDIFFTPANNWTLITFDGRCVFAGHTMNISELKKTLKRIQGDAIVTGK